MLKNNKILIFIIIKIKPNNIFVKIIIYRFIKILSYKHNKVGKKIWKYIKNLK